MFYSIPKWKRKNVAYAPISGLDSNSSSSDLEIKEMEGRERKPKSMWSIKSVFYYIFKTTILGLAVWGFLNLPFRIHQQQQSPAIEQERKSCNCGDTLEETIAMGCKYDSLSATWLPDHCRDDELSAEFETIGDGPNGNWLYYADWEGKILLNVSEVSVIPQRTFVTTFKWHLAHCVWIWLKQFRSSKGGPTVEARFDREEHIRHCYKMFLKRDPLNYLLTGSGVSFRADVIPTVPKHHDDSTHPPSS